MEDIKPKKEKQVLDFQVEGNASSDIEIMSQVYLPITKNNLN